MNNNSLDFPVKVETKSENSETITGTCAGAGIGLITAIAAAANPILGVAIGTAAGFLAGGVSQEMRQQHEIEKIKEENKGKE